MEPEFSTHVNPLHLSYLRNIQLASLEQLFNILDDLDSEFRDAVFYGVYTFIINPDSIQPKLGKEVVGELMKSDISYENFKKKCFELSKTIGDLFLAESVVTSALKYLFNSADPVGSKKGKENLGMVVDVAFGKEVFEEENNEIYGVIRELYDSADQRVAENYMRYDRFCNTVVKQLLETQSERLTGL